MADDRQVTFMARKTEVLIVSSRADNRKILLRALQSLPVNSFSVSTIGQARKLLSSREFAATFCEENVSDGSYRELLAEILTKSKTSRFILMLCTGEWEEYLEALERGATDAIRCPLQSSDIDLSLIHAIREGGGDQAIHARA